MRQRIRRALPVRRIQPTGAGNCGTTVEELKIWSVDNDGNAKVTPLGTTAQTESEGLLEDILMRNPDMLAEGLKLIGRQTRTTGGPLDLLGVEPDGRLSVFELKRGTLSREAVAQVIDYSSDLEAMDTGTLYRSWYKSDDGSWSPNNAATLFIETYKGGIMVGFHAVAVALATMEEFDRLRVSILSLLRIARPYPGVALVRIGGSIEHNTVIETREVDRGPILHPRCRHPDQAGLAAKSCGALLTHSGA